MSERLKPGEEPQQPNPFYVPTPKPEYNLGTSTVPINRYARFALRQEEIDPRLAGTIVEFVNVAYYDENKVGDPEYRRTRLVKRWQRQGLSPEEIDQAVARAGTIYDQYKQLAGLTTEDVLTRQAIIDFESSRMRIRSPRRDTSGAPREEYAPRERVVDMAAAIRKLRQERKEQVKKRLKDNYRKLMRPTDHEIKIQNANERVNFDEDPIYRNGQEGARQKFLNRKLTQRKYNADNAEKLEEVIEDPYERVARVLDLAESNKNIPTLTKMLADKDSLVREAAADVLDQMGWRPTNPKGFAYYCVAKGEWGYVEDAGEHAYPALLNLLTRENDIAIRNASVSLLESMGWNPQSGSMEEQVFYYASMDHGYNLARLGDVAVPHLLKALNNGTLVYHTAVRVFTEIGTPAANRALNKLSKSEDTVLQQLAREALGKDDDRDPIKLQNVIEDSSPQAFWSAVTIFHPEWENGLPSEEKLIEVGRAIYSLPPVGGKIFALKEQTFSPEGLLRPSMTVEEQIKAINNLRQRGELGKGYIHQLTVQGRLPDKFKYAALALILHSPYVHDWREPFFEAPWGKVAPMVHDGGNTEESLNPIWRNVRGRTDFLQRIVPVYTQNLEQLEQLPPHERAKLAIDDMVKARAEQQERERLILEATAYQRLALALHSSIGTVPKSIPEEVRVKLGNHWNIFEQRMNLLLREYNVEGASQVVWFNAAPRQLVGWPGLRHEASWQPIQEQLMRLEATRLQHPELIDRARMILRETTHQINQQLDI